MRTKILRSALVAPLVMLLLGADEPKAPPAPLDPAAVTEEVLAGMRLEAKLVLDDAGAAPRQLIAYRPRPGARATWERVSSGTIAGSITMPDGQVLPVPMDAAAPPDSVTTTRNIVGKRTRNGMIPVNMEILDVTPAAPGGARDPAAGAPHPVNAALGAMKGVTMVLLVDEAGQPVQIDVTGADPAVVAAAQAFADQMSESFAWLPTEPVGKGARWTVVGDLSMIGMQVELVQEFTLLGWDATSVDLGVKMTLKLASGELSFPGIPPEAGMKFERFDGSGTGTLRTDLETLVSTGTLDIDITTDMSMIEPQSGKPLLIQIQVGQSTTFRPAK